MEGIDRATVIRELQAEVDFWKGRSLALSSRRHGPVAAGGGPANPDAGHDIYDHRGGGWLKAKASRRRSRGSHDQHSLAGFA